MGCCLVNLFLVTNLFIYLHAIHDSRIRLEVKLLPIYGLPFLIFICSVFAGLVWCICYITVVVSWELALFSIVIVGCSFGARPTPHLRKRKTRAHPSFPNPLKRPPKTQSPAWWASRCSRTYTFGACPPTAAPRTRKGRSPRAWSC